MYDWQNNMHTRKHNNAHNDTQTNKRNQKQNWRTHRHHVVHPLRNNMHNSRHKKRSNRHTHMHKRRFNTQRTNYVIICVKGVIMIIRICIICGIILGVRIGRIGIMIGVRISLITEAICRISSLVGVIIVWIICMNNYKTVSRHYAYPYAYYCA